MGDNPEEVTAASGTDPSKPPSQNGVQNGRSPNGATGPGSDHEIPTVPLESGVMPIGVIEAPEKEKPTIRDQMRGLFIGKPRDLADKSIFHNVSLVAFLAWVGLGADGLSSCCYGPPEAYVNLGEHRYLAVFLMLAVVGTVVVIARCYSHIIEEFPSGGGGYLVASKLLGPGIGVVSGSALLVDYVLTITVSIAAAGDALFGLLGKEFAPWKLAFEAGAILTLLILNLRGVKESIRFLLPIFILFLVTHVLLIVGSIGLNVSSAGTIVANVTSELRSSAASPAIGIFGMAAMVLHAYSLGAGTYTGLEAVSNSMPVLREPRVATGKRTMEFMAISLAFMAGGLLLCYLLLDLGAAHPEGMTLNQVLSERFVDELGMGGNWLGGLFVILTLVAEGALLVVGAQAGFIDGPRVLANMAHDSWVPRWYANLSERLTVHNGILLIGGMALFALWYTHGAVDVLVLMYSINVFLTFSLSMLGMCRLWWHKRGANPMWRQRLALFVVGAVLCISILLISTWQKFSEGGWITLAVTGLCVGVCMFIQRYYRQVGARLKQLDQTLGQIEPSGEPNLAPPDPTEPAAIILVGNYSGLGIHTLLNAVRFAPERCRSFVFVSAGVVDSGNFKGSGAVDELYQHTEEQLAKYVDLGRRLGVPSTSMMKVGTDPVDDLEELCLNAARRFQSAIVFAGQLVFQKDTWLHRVLHNQTAYSLQRRLQWVGLPMVILPTRVR